MRKSISSKSVFRAGRSTTPFLTSFTSCSASLADWIARLDRCLHAFDQNVIQTLRLVEWQPVFFEYLHEHISCLRNIQYRWYLVIFTLPSSIEKVEPAPSRASFEFISTCSTLFGSDTSIGISNGTVEYVFSFNRS